jgi:hypothetical protein
LCIIVWLTPSALAIEHFRFSLSGGTTYFGVHGPQNKLTFFWHIKIIFF